MDHRHEVWLKLQVVKKLCLQDLKQIYHGMIAVWIATSSRRDQPLNPPQLQKLKYYKDLLRYTLHYLTISQKRLPPEFDENTVEALGKKVVRIIWRHRSGRHSNTASSFVPTFLPVQQQLGHARSPVIDAGNATREQSGKLPKPTSSVSSTLAGDSSSSLDQSDAVWPKVLILRRKYLQDMQELYRLLRARRNMRLPSEHCQELALDYYKEVVHSTIISLLTVLRGNLPRQFIEDTQALDAFQKKLVKMMDIFKL